LRKRLWRKALQKAPYIKHCDFNALRLRLAQALGLQGFALPSWLAKQAH
jgi:hypothetical protein